ncbi:MAG: hypothetical protein RMJ03_01130 [Nitrososphaerota archaeon]|nr:hypothetical protein [Nitrososphaerota archaeon]
MTRMASTSKMFKVKGSWFTSRKTLTNLHRYEDFEIFIGDL